MSLMRMSQDPKWEDCDPMYVYFDARLGLAGMSGATPEQFVEVVMQALDQSDELTDEQLEAAHSALRSRFRLEGQP